MRTEAMISASSPTRPPSEAAEVSLLVTVALLIADAEVAWSSEVASSFLPRVRQTTTRRSRQGGKPRTSPKKPSSIATSACVRVSFGSTSSVSPSDRYAALVGAVAPQLMGCGSASSLAPQLSNCCGSASLAALQLLKEGSSSDSGLVIQSCSRISLAVGRFVGLICSILPSRSISLGSDGAGTRVGSTGGGGGAPVAGAGDALPSMGSVGTVAPMAMGSAGRATGAGGAGGDKAPLNAGICLA
eukprot:scaffold32703_cov54-Phaeocystis_antarctica.AAC.2